MSEVENEELEPGLNVSIQCPDCSNDYMVLAGEKMDIINRKIKTVIKCPQCRRWMFYDDA